METSQERIDSTRKRAEQRAAAERGLSDIRVAGNFIKVIEYGTVHRDSMTKPVLKIMLDVGLVEGNRFISATSLGYSMYELAKTVAPLGKSSHPQAWPFPR